MLKTNQSWGEITVKRIWAEPEMGRTLDGSTYPTGRELDTQIELACRCGNVVKMLLDDFPGRREMRDCGKPDCTVSKRHLVVPMHQGRLAYTTRRGAQRVVFQVYSSPEIKDAIVKMAEDTGESFSRMASILLLESLVLRGWKPENLKALAS